MSTEVLQVKREIREPLPDPRTADMLQGRPFTFGETIAPDAVSYPGWELTHIQIEGNEVEGWLFGLAPHAITPVGFVERPEGLSPDERPIIEEYIIQGSGWVVIENPGGHLVFEPIDTQHPVLLRYTDRTCVAYLAGEEGLVGVNCGIPPGIPELALPDGDTRATEDFWNLYRRMKREHDKYAGQRAVLPESNQTLSA